MKKEIKVASFFYLFFFLLFLFIPQRNIRSAVSHVDVIAHIIGFFLMYFVLHRGLGLGDFVSLFITLVVAAATEGIQYFIPWRNCNIIDFLADISGMSIAFIISQKSGMLERVIATFGFVGYVRIGPGTIASFITTLLVYVAKPSFLFILEGLILVLLSGIVSSSLEAKRSKQEDPREVVVDEVTGTLTAFLFLPSINALYLLLAFVFFRLYDIIKPFGIKKVENIEGGAGIMFDDELAGIYAGLSTLLVAFFLKKGGIL